MKLLSVELLSEIDQLILERAQNLALEVTIVSRKQDMVALKFTLGPTSGDPVIELGTYHLEIGHSVSISGWTFSYEPGDIKIES